MEIARPKTDSFLIRHATAIAIGTVTLLMLLATLMFWRQEEASTEAKGWLVHTYDVVGHTESLLSKLEDAETGERAYLFTANQEYLEPYQEALRDAPDGSAASGQQQRRAENSGADTLGMKMLKSDPVLGPGVVNTALQRHRSIKQELAYIRNLTADNPVQQSNLDEMDDVTQKLLDYLASTIQARQNRDVTTTGAPLDIHRGKELMDHARTMVRIMESEENHLLALRTEADEINTQHSKWMTFSGVALFYVAMVLSIALFHSRPILGPAGAVFSTSRQCATR